jgi:hypothetical protein
MDNIRDLGDLTNLRDLQICFAELEPLDDMERRQRLDVLRCSLEKLCNLRYLLTDSKISSTYALNPLSASTCLLQRLQRLWVFSRVPVWIGELHNLFDLDLAVEVLENDIGILAQLQSLSHLKLHIEGTPEAEDKLVICGTGFPVLKYFRLSSKKISELTFEAGAMPSVQELDIRLDSHYGTYPMGIKHLLSLKNIHMELWVLSPLDDGFRWRKYRQKDILGAKHPRLAKASSESTLNLTFFFLLASERGRLTRVVVKLNFCRGYFRCIYRHSQGCKAERQVQRTDNDSESFHITYRLKHTCTHTVPLPQPGQEQRVQVPQLWLPDRCLSW